MIYLSNTEGSTGRMQQEKGKCTIIYLSNVEGSTIKLQDDKGKCTIVTQRAPLAECKMTKVITLSSIKHPIISLFCMFATNTFIAEIIKFKLKVFRIDYYKEMQSIDHTI